MTTQVTTELVVDASGAAAGVAQYDASIKKAEASTNKMVDAADKAQAAITKNIETMTRGSARVAASWARQAGAVDPVIKAQQELARATKAAESAVNKGIATQEQANSVLSAYKARLDAANIAAGRAAASTKLNAGQVQNLTYQLNDIGVMLASGQSPFVMLMQQGMQMAQIFGPGVGLAGALKATGAALMSFISSPLTIFVVAIAAAAGAVELLFDAFSGGETAEDILKRQKQLVEDIAKAYSDATDAAERLSMRQGQMWFTNAAQEQLQITKEMAGATEVLNKQLGITVSNTENWFGRNVLGGGAPNEGLLEDIKGFIQAIENGNADVAKFRDHLDEIGREFPTKENKDFIAVLQQWTEPLFEAEKRSKELAAAIALMQGTATDAQKALLGLGTAADELAKNFSKAMETLGDIGLPDLGDKGKALEAFNEAMANTQGLEERLLVTREYEKALDRIDERAAEEKAKDAAEESAKAAKKLADSIKGVNDNLAFEIDQLGRSAREQAIYNELKKAGVTIDSAAGQAIASQAGRLFDLTAAQKAQTEAAKEAAKETEKLVEARKKLYDDIIFERQLIGLSEEEASIANRLRSVYGTDIPTALNSWEAGQLRVNEQLKKAQELGDAIKDSLAGAIEDVFTGGIKSVDEFLDKFTSGIAQAAAKAMSERLVDKLFGGALAPVDSAGMKTASALSSAASEVVSAAPPLLAAAKAVDSSAVNLKTAANTLAGGIPGVGSMAGIGAKGAGISGGTIPGGDVAAYIRQAATLRGIDPEIALRVAASEGGTDGQWRVGDAGKSFGPYQLYTGGGLGNTFQKQTGLSLTPDTVRQQIDFALNQAAAGGWGPWYGAAKVGVGNWDGLRGSRSMNLTPASGPIGSFANDRDSTITGGMAPGGWSVGKVVPGATAGTVPVSIVSASAPAFSGITKLVQSPMFQQAISGFSMGFQSQSPVTGALGGALSGLMSGGPVGAVVGGLAGAIGGLLGKSRAAREEMERAQEAWDGMKDQVRSFRDELTGEVIGSLGESFRAAKSQYRDFAKAAEAAGESVRGMKGDLEEFKREAIQDFNRGFGAVMRSLKTGLGDSDPYLESAQAIAGIREELLGFIADTKRARGPKSLDKARDAAQGFVLSQIGETPEISATRAELRRINGTKNEAIALLHDLGMGINKAIEEVNHAIDGAISDLRKKFEQDLRIRLNDATGKSAFNDFQKLIEQSITDFKDADRIGADWTLVSQVFAAEAQEIVDNGKIMGSEFDELIQRFPQLQGIIHEFVGTVEDAANRLERINRTAQSIVDYVNQLRSGPQTTLSPTARLSAAQAAYNSQIVLAQGGNLDAQSSITQYADDFLTAAREVYASTTEFQSIFTQVQNQLLALPSVQEATDPVVTALRDVLLGVQGTTAAVNAQTTTLSSAITSSGGNMAVANALIPKFNQLDVSVNGLLDFTEFANGLANSPLAKNVTLGTLLTASQLSAAGLSKDSTVGNLLTASQLATAGLASNAVVSGLLTSAQLAALGLSTDASTTKLLTAQQLNAAGIATDAKLGTLLTSAQLSALGLSKDTTVGSLLTANQLATQGLAKDNNLTKIFNEMDLNGDAQITKLEALLSSDGLTRSAIEEIQSGGATGQEIATALSTYFNTLDQSVNGLLDKNEIASLGLATGTQINNLYKLLDTDGDGQISRLDLIKAQILGTTKAIDDQDASIDATSNALTSDAVDGVKKWSKNSAVVTKALGNAIVPYYQPMQDDLRNIAKATWDTAKRGRPPDVKMGDFGFKGFAEGGIIGNGLRGVDSVMARTTNGSLVGLAGGEGILTANAVSSIGPAMVDFINRNNRLPTVDDRQNWMDQNKILIAGFSAVVTELRAHGKMTADKLDALERRARIEASREKKAA